MGRRRTTMFKSSMSKSQMKMVTGCLMAPITIPLNALAKALKKKNRRNG